MSSPGSEPVTPPNPAPTPAAPVTPPTPTPATPVEPHETPEQARSRLNAEAAAYRIQAKDARELARDAEAKLAALKTSAETDKQSAIAAERSKVDALKPRIIEAELKAALVGEGVLDPELVGLVGRDGITLDENGAVTGVTEAVAKFKAAKPNFFRAPAAPAPAPVPAPTSSGNPSAPPANPNPSPTNVKDMSASQYRDYKSGIRRRLRGGR